MIQTNTKVITPLGEGIVQGRFEVKAGADAVTGVLVRLPINDETRRHLKRSNCMTPRAAVSGLWVFQEEAVSASGKW